MPFCDLLKSGPYEGDKKLGYNNRSPIFNRMTLDEYRRKRSFKKTPEPAPQAPPEQQRTEAQTASVFIQPHHGRRPHYELRLAACRVLTTWAAPKGANPNAGRKQLVVLGG